MYVRYSDLYLYYCFSLIVYCVYRQLCQYVDFHGAQIKRPRVTP